MTEADHRLKALFAEDEPPARDPQFQAAVFETLARREFTFEVVKLAGATVLVGLSLWALWPALLPAVTQLSETFAPAAAAGAIAVTVLALLSAGPLRQR